MADEPNKGILLTPPADDPKGGPKKDGAAPNAAPADKGDKPDPKDPANPDPNGGKKDDPDPNKKNDAPDAKKGDKKPDGAPETYTFKVPEGYELDKETTDEFEQHARTMGLSQDNAQKLIDLQVKVVAKAHAAQAEEFRKLSESWRQEALKALGAEPQKQLAFASKAIQAYGTPKLKEVLQESGLGNHPELVQFFVKVGQTVTEDGLPGGAAGGGKKSTAQIMYPEMASKN